MSWSVSLTINTGLEERVVIHVGNYTYNVAPMYSKAMGITISDLDKKICSKAIPILRKGILNMTEKPAVYKKMNSPNGWGKYETALEFLEEIYKGCINNPKCKIRVF